MGSTRVLVSSIPSVNVTWINRIYFPKNISSGFLSSKINQHFIGDDCKFMSWSVEVNLSSSQQRIFIGGDMINSVSLWHNLRPHPFSISTQISFLCNNYGTSFSLNISQLSTWTWLHVFRLNCQLSCKLCFSWLLFFSRRMCERCWMEWMLFPGEFILVIIVNLYLRT